VRLGSLELACGAENLSQGAEVTVAIRPEDIVLQGVTGSEENAWESRIGAMEFLGSFVRADLLADETESRIFRADVSVNLVRRQNLKEGDSLPIMVPKERIRIYPGITDRE
jgi:iron(III) transport system ATP-binding protein